MYAQQDKNRSGSPESSGLPLDSVLGAVPQRASPAARDRGTSDTLVGTATETEADVFLLQKEGAVHQHIQLMKKFPSSGPIPAGGPAPRRGSRCSTRYPCRGAPAGTRRTRESTSG